ncbi:MAG TPA: hypothetical protein VKE69_09330, partial [Planctomycetota bacterium]|nr:hypothetical protein [Planctomycetota bacterium]
SRRPMVGGGILSSLFARYQEKENKDSQQARAYAPPFLPSEGDKVRPAWVFGFLKQPYTIRPQLKVHMPNFGLSDGDAMAIAQWFTEKYAAGWPRRLAKEVRFQKGFTQEELGREAHVGDNVRLLESNALVSADVIDRLTRYAKDAGISIPDAPHALEFIQEREEAYRTAVEAENPHYFEHALAMTTPKGGNCFNCHWRGETKPTGPDDAWAPDFDRVRERLRPDWIRRWLSDPQQIYPGTKMPTLFQPGQQVFQDIFPASSEVQIRGLKDLLMNWERYGSGATSRPVAMSTPKDATPPAGSGGTR